MKARMYDGGRVLLFVNNPHDHTYGWDYDILTANDTDSYSVSTGRVNIEDGDAGIVYRVGANAHWRDPGAIVAVSRITSSPWYGQSNYAFVNWELKRLAPEAWITSDEMKKSGLWANRQPLSRNTASGPSGVYVDQWDWLAPRLGQDVVDWMSRYPRLEDELLEDLMLPGDSLVIHEDGSEELRLRRARMTGNYLRRENPKPKRESAEAS